MSFDNKDIDKQVKLAIERKIIPNVFKVFDQQYVEELRDRIVHRTQLGNFIDPSTGNTVKKPLADITKRVRQGKARIFTKQDGSKLVITDGFDRKDLNNRQRKGIRDKFTDNFKKPKLASTTTPGKSNLTATGQLLKSLTVVKLRLKNSVGFSIRIGDRRGRDMFGESSKIGNKELAKIQEDNGRKFLGFTNSQRNKIIREIRDRIIAALKFS